MDFMNSVGGWIPIWIIGAPLVLGLIDWMMTPKVNRGSSKTDVYADGRVPVGGRG